jgi:hypothetical protein
VLGFFLTYSQQQTQNGGIIQKIVYWFSHQLLNLPHQSSLLLEGIVDVIVIGTACLLVVLLRQRERISMEAAALLLISTVFAISSHVFPWYVSALLPWIAMMIGPIWVGKRLSGKMIAVITAWYFTWTVLIGYFYLDIVDWHIFYLLVYDIVAAGVAVAAIIRLINMQRMRTTSG